MSTPRQYVASGLELPKVSIPLPAASSPSASSARQDLRAKAQDILDCGWEPSTHATYSRALQVHVHGLEKTVDAALLPVDSADKLMLIFAAMDGMAWRTIQVNKSAIRAWHTCHNLGNVFDQCWDYKALHFWRGLKKRANHDSRAKQPLSIQNLAAFVRHRRLAGTPAGIRDGACVVFCFFGLRRVSEAIALRESDVQVESDSITFFIHRQKNDPCGLGQRCWVPNVDIEGFNPAQLVLDWIRCRSSMVGASGTSFFCNTSRSPGAPITADLWRKNVCAHFKDNATTTHSFCKGGTQWYMHVANVPHDVVHAQGGWHSSGVMNTIYGKLPEAMQKTKLLHSVAAVQTAGAKESSTGSTAAGTVPPLHERPFPENPAKRFRSLHLSGELCADDDEDEWG